jgi:hypothetical protein
MSAQCSRPTRPPDLANKPKTTTDSLLEVFKNPAIWAFGLIYFCIQSGVYAINFWLPSIIKNMGFSDNLVIGWLSAIPYLLAAVFMLVVGRSADLRKERRWHLVVPMLMGAVGLIIAVNFATTTGHCDPWPDHRHHGRPHRPADVLAGAHRHAQRRRGRGRPGFDQLHGPDGGLLEPVCGGFCQRRHRFHRPGAVPAGGGDRRG